jgi:hypothetical protein
MVKYLSVGVAALLLVLGSAGCGGEDPEGRGRGAQVSGAGKADTTVTCQGSCGGMAAAGCWCDDQCTFYGDCCLDKQQLCDAGPAPCHGVCVYGAHCADYCPPGASCVQVVDEGPAYWQVLGCRVW